MYWRIAALTVLLAALTIFQADHWAAVGQPATVGPPAPIDDAFYMPEEVVRNLVEAGGAQYAGDCAATRAPEHFGMICSRLMGEQYPLLAYLIGRTFSEFTTWVFVRHTSAGWQLAATTPLDFFSMDERIPWPE